VWQGIGWKAMDGGNWNTIKKTIPLVDFVFPWISHIAFSFIPTVVICLAGESMVGLMKDYLPMDGVAMKTLFTVGSLLPAVGIAILCKQVVQKPLDWITFAFGFILAAVMGCNLICSAVIAVFFALINFKIEQLKLMRPAVAAAGGAAFDDEEEEDI
jgi:PTS system mannose-specific IIC component